MMMKQPYVKMESSNNSWRSWLWFKDSFLLPTKSILLNKISSTKSRTHSKGINGDGLVSLYKDMESCGEYSDIRVMWEIIHHHHQGSTPKRERTTHNYKTSFWRFYCFN
ncbi:hypothetical protein CsatB_000343 [Cannabis sativa]